MKYRIWHNSADKRLNDAVRRLRGKVNRYKMLKRRLRPWEITGWALVPVPLTSLGLYMLLFHQVWEPAVIMAFAITAYYVVLGTMLLVNRFTRMRLANQLRKHQYGAAIMWDLDAGWLAIQSALQARGIIFVDFINDVRIEEELIEYLMSSRHVRLRLIEEKLQPKPEHPDMVSLQRFADIFAMHIITALDSPKSNM